jgi:hypothetical protein
MGSHPIRHPERASEERTLGILDQYEAPGYKRRGRSEVVAFTAETEFARRELQGQPDACSASRHVVVEVGIQALEARVEIRSECHDQDLDICGLERERPDEATQSEVCSRLLIEFGSPLDPCDGRGEPTDRIGLQTERATEEPVDVGIGNV